MRSILKLSNTEARRYLLSNNAYCAFDLPSYFNFEKILQDCREKLAGKDYLGLIKVNETPRDYEGVNYTICHNKNSSHAWRKLQLTHPMIYVGITNLITKKENWNTIIERFAYLKCDNITCTSIPTVIKRPPVSDRECAIENWSKNLTNRAISLSCEYNYLLKTDIANCYDSLQTHMISWALEGNHKTRRCWDNHEKLGGQLSIMIQDMSYGLASGIPQGSVLSDLLVELILAYIDTIIQERLRRQHICEVQILRYRDDYHIYTHDKITASKIMKVLTETLALFNLRINLAKTLETDDIVLTGWKPDKFAWLKIEDRVLNSNLPLRSRLMLIKEHSVLFPDCGSLKLGLAKLYLNYVFNMRSEPRDLDGVIAIIVDIMYRNPTTYPVCTAILLKLINLLKNDAQVTHYLKMIAHKFEIIPHNEHLHIWLQRLTLGINPNYRYSCKLCAILYDRETKLWNSDWLGEIVNDDLIVDEIMLENLPQDIPPHEVCLFNAQGGSG